VKVLHYQTLRKSIEQEPRGHVQTDGQTDMTKMVVTILDYANNPKTVLLRAIV
jgi:hypothetical protein